MNVIRTNKQFEIFEVHRGNMQSIVGCLIKGSTAGKWKDQGRRGPKTQENEKEGG